MKSLIKPAFSALLALSVAAGTWAADDNWLTSFPEAVKISKKTGKPILANFTGSDWCVWCKRLDKEVFIKPEFKQWATKNVILLKLDYPSTPPKSAAIQKERANLAAKYGVDGFPTILFLRADGKAFGKYGYDRGGPVHWTRMANRLLALNTSGSRPLRFAAKSEGYPPYVSKKLYAENDYRGKTAPKLTVAKWLTGAAPDTAGKVVLIDFWATWCPPCRELIPELATWQKKFKKDLVVIGVSDETPEKLSKFMQTTKMPYNVGIDQKHTTSNILGIQGIPHVLVITPDHVVRWQGFPLDESDALTEAKLQQIIDASKKPAVNHK